MGAAFVRAEHFFKTLNFVNRIMMQAGLTEIKLVFTVAHKDLQVFIFSLLYFSFANSTTDHIFFADDDFYDFVFYSKAKAWFFYILFFFWFIRPRLWGFFFQYTLKYIWYSSTVSILCYDEICRFSLKIR